MEAVYELVQVHKPCVLELAVMGQTRKDHFMKPVGLLYHAYFYLHCLFYGAITHQLTY